MLIFDLTDSSYFPSDSLLYMFCLVLAALLIGIYRSRKKAISKFEKGLSIVFLSVFSIVLAVGNYNDYRIYKVNIADYESGNYKTLKGKVTGFRSYSGKASQMIEIDGIEFFSEKGSSHSYDEDFHEAFSIGQEITIEYVNIRNGIIRVYI